VVRSQLFQLLAAKVTMFGAKVTIIHRRYRKSDESWVGRFGQVWLKPDIKYKYLVIFLYFWLVFLPFFPLSLSHLAIKNLQNHFISINLLSIILIFSFGFGRLWLVVGCWSRA
jgi:hypothetical protein